MSHWVLDTDGRTPKTADTREWAVWYETHDKERVVAWSSTPLGNISTVFLGIDYSFGSGPPILFETMIFEAKPPLIEDSEYMWRYATWDEAAEGHARILTAMMCGQDPGDIDLGHRGY